MIRPNGGGKSTLLQAIAVGVTLTENGDKPKNISAQPAPPDSSAAISSIGSSER
jgi:predicted ATPase